MRRCWIPNLQASRSGSWTLGLQRDAQELAAAAKLLDERQRRLATFEQAPPDTTLAQLWHQRLLAQLRDANAEKRKLLEKAVI
eukprot:jgi/Hompol1/2033/HPOL_005048-RA